METDTRNVMSRTRGMMPWAVVLGFFLLLGLVAKSIIAGPYVALSLLLAAAVVTIPILLMRSAFRPLIAGAIVVMLLGIAAILLALGLHAISPKASEWLFGWDSMGIGRWLVAIAGLVVTA